MTYGHLVLKMAPDDMRNVNMQLTVKTVLFPNFILENYIIHKP